MTSFDREYAKIYDLIYAGKDYQYEVDLVDKQIKNLSLTQKRCWIMDAAPVIIQYLSI